MDAGSPRPCESQVPTHIRTHHIPLQRRRKIRVELHRERLRPTGRIQYDQHLFPQASQKPHSVRYPYYSTRALEDRYLASLLFEFRTEGSNPSPSATYCIFIPQRAHKKLIL